MSAFRLSLWKLIDTVAYRLFGGIMRRFVVVSARNARNVLAKTQELRDQGFQVSLDVMVEDITDPVMTAQVAGFYHELLGAMMEHNRSNIVIKPTSLGLGLANVSSAEAETQFGTQVRLLLEHMVARDEVRVGVRQQIEIDVESTRTMESAYRAIAKLRTESPELAPYVRMAIPMHMKALPKLCAQYELLGHPVRIVKGTGVYHEEPTLLVESSEVLARYRHYALECLVGKTHPYIATMHDEKLLRQVLTEAHARGYGKDKFTIQMLYGLWTGLGRKLLAEGYTVCVYVPTVLPWCARASDGYVRRRVSMFRELIWKLLLRRE